MSGNPKEKRSTPIKRSPHKGSEKREDLLDILHRSRVGHVAIDDGGPWAGIVPIHQVIGEPRAANNLDPKIPAPDYIKRW